MLVEVAELVTVIADVVSGVVDGLGRDVVVVLVVMDTGGDGLVRDVVKVHVGQVVVVLVFETVVVEEARDESDDEAADEADTHGDERASDLDTSAAEVAGAEDGGEQTADEAANGEEEGDASGIVDADAADDATAVGVKNAGEDTGEVTDDVGDEGFEEKVATSSHDHTSDQGRVEDVLHVELALVQDGGEEVCTEHGADQAEVGVDDGNVGGEVGGSAGAVERGPEDPKEESADHRVGVGVDVGAVVDVVARVGVVQHRGGAVAVEAAEGEDVHGAADIAHVERGEQDLLVEGEQHDADEGDEQDLEVVGLSEDGAERNQHREGAVLALDEEGSPGEEVAVAEPGAFPQRAPQEVVLDGEGGDPEALGERGQLETLHEGEQEGHSDKHHDVDVLEEAVATHTGRHQRSQRVGRGEDVGVVHAVEYGGQDLRDQQKDREEDFHRGLSHREA